MNIQAIAQIRKESLCHPITSWNGPLLVKNCPGCDGHALDLLLLVILDWASEVDKGVHHDARGSMRERIGVEPPPFLSRAVDQSTMIPDDEITGPCIIMRSSEDQVAPMVRPS